MSPTQYARLSQNTESKVILDCAEALEKRRATMFIKRAFDIFASLVLSVLLSPVMLIIALVIVCDSRGGALFKQKRVGRFGKEFTIFKFRTMRADNAGSQVTTGDDDRITRVGKLIRGCRLDELPQVWNVIFGQMSFVGPRPESPYFVGKYKTDWNATLLVRPGITCRSSIAFADEAGQLDSQRDPQHYYIGHILPKKCGMNIDYVRNISLVEDVRILFATVGAVLKK